MTLGKTSISKLYLPPKKLCFLLFLLSVFFPYFRETKVFTDICTLISIQPENSASLITLQDTVDLVTDFSLGRMFPNICLQRPGQLSVWFLILGSML